MGTFDAVLPVWYFFCHIFTENPIFGDVNK